MLRGVLLREPWRTRLLFLSVAANLFAVALIGAHVAMRPPHGPPGSEGAIERMARDLPAQDAERFRAVMRQAHRQNELARLHMDEARNAMSRAIGQTPYDEAAVRQAMQAWQAAWIDWSNGLGSSMLTALSRLSPDGRRRLAEAGQRHPPP